MSADRYTQLLADLQAAQSEEERFWVGQNFSLSNMSEALQEMVWAAAIPHWFDENFLAALVGKEDISADNFQTLLALSYVEEFPGRGWNVHERTRDMLLKRLWETDRERYRELSRRAANYCEKQDQENTLWRVETLYHQLLAQKPGAVDDFASQGIYWHNRFEYEKIEALIRPVLEVIEVGRIKGNAAAWAYYRQGKLDITFNRYREARTYLEQSLDQETSDMSVRANCIKALGDVHIRMAEYGEAREKYEEARPIYAGIGDRLGEANCIKALGDVHYMLDEYGEAREKYEEARPIYAGIGDRLGEANCIRSLGDLYGELEQVEKAIETLEDALQRFRELGLEQYESGCYNSMGNIFYDQKRYSEAVAAYDTAIEIRPSAMWYRNRASSYINMDQYDLAAQDLDKAEAIQSGQPYALLHRGVIALWQKQPQQALAYFKQAAQLRPKDGGFRIWLALALLVEKETENALKELKKGIELTHNPKDVADTTEDLDKLAQTYGDSPEMGEMRRLLETRE